MLAGEDGLIGSLLQLGQIVISALKLSIASTLSGRHAGYTRCGIRLNVFLMEFQ